MNMVEAGDNGVEHYAKGDETPARQSIKRAIEKRLAMKIRGITVPESSGLEFKVVARDGMDGSIRNPGHGKTAKLKELLNLNKVGLDSLATEGDLKVENDRQNDLLGRRGQLKIDVHKGHHVDCVGETSEGADPVAAGNRVQILQKTPKCQTVRHLMMVLKDNDVDETSLRSATAVDNNHLKKFCFDASPGIAYRPSTEEGTPKVAEKLKLEKQDPEVEAYILNQLSALQPSFRTLFEPSVAGTSSSTVGSSQNKTGQSKWKKKIEDIVAKVTNWGSQKHLQSPLENILYESDVKGILKMKWEGERKKSSQVKQRTRWPRSCICCRCLHSNCTGRKMEEWEFQLEEYSSAW